MAGILIGVTTAAFAARGLSSQLFGVTRADPLTFALVPLALVAVAALACYLPAIRETPRQRCGQNDSAQTASLGLDHS